MSTAEAARFLGVNSSRVRQMILNEGLPARKIGRDWLIERRALEQYRQTREQEAKRPGRPFKRPAPDSDSEAG